MLERYVFLISSIEEMEDKVHGHELISLNGKQIPNPMIDVMLTYNSQALRLGSELGIGVFSAAKAARQQAIADGENPQARVGVKGKKKSGLLDFTARSRAARIAADEQGA